VDSISPNSTDWLHEFRELGAIWQLKSSHHPHVKTSMSGKHVDAYFNSDLIASRPEIVDAVVDSVLIPALKTCGHKPTWVVGYAPYSILVAYACAQKPGVRCGYSKPSDNYDISFPISSNDTVLVVADDLYTGDAVIRTIDTLKTMGAKIAPYTFALMNLSGSDQLGECHIIAGGNLPARKWAPDSCTLCNSGSEALLSRPNWQLFRAPAKNK
jgi:orotate phosphoribosyltransferase